MTTLFWDKNIGTAIPIALQLLNPPPVSIKYYLEEYPGTGDTAELGDEGWLEDVGNSGWFVISKDQRMHRRPPELQALRQYNVGLFYFSEANEPKWETLKTFVLAFDRILTAVRNEPRPFVFKINADGSLDKVI